ncbi:hypothetical protein D5086_005773 [Populus alba]|uniref:Uncharacterized protein n=1 Tax=Populus alba TaxID=43335 RepID=A0ACC4CU61_POPAL
MFLHLFRLSYYSYQPWITTSTCLLVVLKIILSTREKLNLTIVITMEPIGEGTGSTVSVYETLEPDICNITLNMMMVSVFSSTLTGNLVMMSRENVGNWLGQSCSNVRWLPDILVYPRKRLRVPTKMRSTDSYQQTKHVIGFGPIIASPVNAFSATGDVASDLNCSETNMI